MGADSAGDAIVGRYQIFEELGRGGMGVVHRAVDVETGAVVALKSISRADGARQAALALEIRALSRLRHPQIVGIVDRGTHDGLPWYAMELLDGPTLLDCIGPGSSTPAASTWLDGDVVDPAEGWIVPAPVTALPRALGLVHALCAPLAYLHGEGLVHRDLKPANVRLRRDGVPVLLDFGLSARSSGRDALGSGALVGTPEIAAPEQIRGDPADPRTDLYALGCLLLQLVTGEPPFPGDPASAIHGHLRVPAPAPSSRVAGLPAGLDELCARLLAKDPRDRPGGAEQVAESLVALGAEVVPAAAGPPPRPFLFRPALAGREPLVRELDARIGRAASGQGGVVLLAGPSGAGRTRVLVAAARRAREQRQTVLTVALSPAGRAEASDPIASVLRQVGRVLARRGPEVAPRVLGARAGLLTSVEPTLARLPGLALDPVVPLGVEEERTRLATWVADTVRALGQVEPVLWLVDDLQWADAPVLRVLHDLASADLAGVCVVGSYRSEEVGPRLAALAERVEVLTVEPLSAAAVGEVVADMLGAAPPPALVEAVQARCGGSPFFVGELLQAALDRGALTRTATGWQADLGELPDGIEALLRARLEGLDAVEGEVLARAALFGRLIEGAALGTGDAVLDAVLELLRRQVLVVPPEGGLAFAHEPLRVAALSGLAPARRRELAEATARSLDASEARTSWLPTLAHLWEEALDLRRARATWLEAAAVADAGSAFGEAARLYGLALRVPGDGDDLELRLRVGDLMVRTGRAEEALGILAGRDGATPELRDRLLAVRARALDASGDVRGAIGLLRAASESAGGVPDVQLHLLLGLCLARLRDPEGRTVLRAVADRPDARPAARCSAWLQLAQIGIAQDPKDAGAQADIARAEAILPPGDVPLRLLLLRTRARAAVLGSDPAGAIALLAPMIDALEAQGLIIEAGRGLNLVCLAHFLAGDPVEADRAGTRALSMLERAGNRVSASFSTYYLARIARVGFGDLDRAERMVDRSEAFLGGSASAADRLELEVERAHLALARGEDAAASVARIAALRTEVGDAGALAMVEPLERALAWRASGGELVRGEAPPGSTSLG